RVPVLRNPITGCCACGAASGHGAAAPPSSVMNYDVSLLMAPVLPTERITHLKYGRRLLHCGISIRPMPGSGQERRLSVCLHKVRFTSVSRHGWWVSALRVRARNRFGGESFTAYIRRRRPRPHVANAAPAAVPLMGGCIRM